MPPIEKLLAGAEQHRTQSGRPLVTLTYAQSLDGSLAARRGNSLRLSGPESSRLTHQLRAAHDAILAGIGTVLADDPSLTVRHVQGNDPQPVILDSRLRFPPDAKMLGNQVKPWVFTGKPADEDKKTAIQAAGGRVFELPLKEAGRLDLKALLNFLADMEVNSLMVEGGASVLTSFLAQGLADLLVVTIAPRLVGGLRSVESLLASAEEKVLQVNDFPLIYNMESERLGDDLIVSGWLKPDNT